MYTALSSADCGNDVFFLIGDSSSKLATSGFPIQYETEPYRGGPVDGPQNGHPPAPWHIPVQPSGNFVRVTLKCEVPHTATVVGCNKCFSQGYIRCWHCHGRGMRRCISCHGSGRTSRTRFENGESYTVREISFTSSVRPFVTP